jgi:hypothetical protein
MTIGSLESSDDAFQYLRVSTRRSSYSSTGGSPYRLSMCYLLLGSSHRNPYVSIAFFMYHNNDVQTTVQVDERPEEPLRNLARSACPSFSRAFLAIHVVRPFGDNRTPRSASRPSLAARRGPELRHSHDARRDKRAIGYAKDRDVACSPLVDIMKVPTALFALASGASAHTIFQQMYVNGVSPGHQVGIRVPSYDGVRSLSHLF